MRRQAAMEGEDVDILLSGDPPLPQEAYRRIQGWYIAAVDHSSLPSQITLEQITAERVELYRNVPLPW